MLAFTIQFSNNNPHPNQTPTTTGIPVKAQETKQQTPHQKCGRLLPQAPIVCFITPTPSTNKKPFQPAKTGVLSTH